LSLKACTEQNTYAALYRALLKTILGDADNGLRDMQQALAKYAAPVGLIRDVLEDAQLLARCPVPPEGCDQVVAMLRAALVQRQANF
jgi:hypothetical protein